MCIVDERGGMLMLWYFFFCAGELLTSGMCFCISFVVVVLCEAWYYARQVHVLLGVAFPSSMALSRLEEQNCFLFEIGRASCRERVF